MMLMKKKETTTFLWNTVGIFLNSLTSLFFLIAVTRVNGIDSAGVFSFGFSVTSIFYIVAIYSGRTFQVTESSKHISDNDFLISRCISVSLMILLSIAYTVLGNYNSEQSFVFVIMILFRAFEAMSDVMYGILQKRNRLDAVGKSLFFKALLSIVIFIIVDLFTNNLLLSIFMILIVYGMAFIFVDSKIALSYKDDKKHNVANLKFLFKSGFYTFLFTFISLYVVNAPRFAIDKFMSESYQAIFSYIFMPSTVMLLFGQFLCHPYLVKMRERIDEKDRKGFVKIVSGLSLAIMIVGILALAGAALLGIPVLQIIYSVNLMDYKWSLLIIIMGAILYTLSVVISNALITMRATKPQVYIYILGSIIIFFLSDRFVGSYGVIGGAWSYCITMLIQLSLYVIVYIRSINKMEIEEQL